MKTQFSRLIVLISIVLAFGISDFMLQVTNDKSDINLSVMNLKALADGEGGEMDCWSISSPCYIYNCSYVTLCEQPCHIYKVDEWSNPGTCSN